MILSRDEIVYRGCWVHARRKFFDARDIVPHEGAMVMLMIKVLDQVAVCPETGSIYMFADELDEMKSPVFERGATNVLRVTLLPNEAAPRYTG